MLQSLLQPKLGGEITGENRRLRSEPVVSVKGMLRQLLTLRVAPQVSDDRSFSAVYDFANVANDVFSIFALHQVFVLNQISDRFLNCSPYRRTLPTHVGVGLALRNPLHGFVLLDRFCHTHHVRTGISTSKYVYSLTRSHRAASLTEARSAA